MRKKDYIDRDMRKGMVKIMILSYIKSNKTYPYALLKFVASLKKVHGYGMLDGVGKNDIYNLTSQLEKEGYLKSKAQFKGNKVQKVFTLTSKGNAIVMNKNKIFKETFSALKRLVKAEFNDQ